MCKSIQWERYPPGRALGLVTVYNPLSDLCPRVTLNVSPAVTPADRGGYPLRCASMTEGTCHTL